MDTLVPDLHLHLAANASSSAADPQAKRDDESRAQEAALEQLAERVNAARCIV